MARRRTLSPPLEPHVRAEAGEALLHDLQSLFCQGEISAKSFCELAYNAGRAGAAGNVKRWGCQPSGYQTGHYNRHIETMIRKLGMEIVQPVLVDVPCQMRRGRSRNIQPVPMRPLHELLQHELQQPAREIEVRHSLANAEWPAVFRDHEVVARASPGELVIPLGVFVDAAQYGGSAGAGRTKSILVVSLVNLVTKRRHVGIVFRKQTQCRCGCKGNCSFHRLWTFLRWSIDSLAAGRHPRLNWDNAAWADPAKRERGGTSLGFRGAVCYMMADWEGLCSNLSVPTWRSNDHPCPLCGTTKINMHRYR